MKLLKIKLIIVIDQLFIYLKILINLNHKSIKIIPAFAIFDLI